MKLSMARNRVPYRQSVKRHQWLDEHINTEITAKAIQHAINQYDLCVNSRESTTYIGNFFKSMGILCRHIIKDYLSTNLKLKASQFAEFWHFMKPENDPFIDNYVEPVIRGQNQQRLYQLDLPLIHETESILAELVLLPPPLERQPVVLPPHKVLSKGRPRKDKKTTRNRSQ